MENEWIAPSSSLLTAEQESEVNRQLEIIRRGVVDLVPDEGLVEKLRHSVVTGVPLRVKLGMDPTAPDIHLGHSVVLQKIRELQDLGHVAHIVIGDFTGQVGDPTGRTETRKQLTPDKVKENAETYVRQVFKILNPQQSEIVYNSSWLTSLQFADVLHLASKLTVARVLEREDFTKRFRENRPIHLHEFFYPLMQAYDSVHLRTDIEIGGTDQTFNLLMGRALQREFGIPTQIVLTMPLLEGLDGVQKMSKSLGNYIGIDEPVNDLFGKVMSVPDALLIRYYELLSNAPMHYIRGLKIELEQENTNPRDIKMNLAKELVHRFWGAEAVDEAKLHWETVFQAGKLPRDIPEVQINPGAYWVVKLLLDLQLVTTNGEARRAIAQGAVKRNGHKLLNDKEDILVASGDVFQVGKRKFVRCIVI